ncbi:MAG: lipocalin-like domain-containing protein, partial [Thermoanaerobaculia bacterium]|nr:lipocalin-like domain-containing protein [Thermoanaerobaculia bacterium]
MRLITVGSIVLSLIGIVGCAETPAPPAAEASASGTSDAEAFVGNWRLAGIERRDAEDQPLPLNPGALGEGATGFIMYDAGGYMGVVIQAADRGRYAGERRTPEEALEDLRSYVSYFGRYTVDDEEGVVTHHLVGSLFPGGAGSDYRRAYELTGDRLILQPPPNDAGEVTRLTWERVPKLADPSAEQRRFFGFWRLGGIE